MQQLDRGFKSFSSLLLIVIGLGLNILVFVPAVGAEPSGASDKASVDDVLNRIEGRFASGEKGTVESQEKEFALLSDILQKNPDNARARYVLSLFLTNRGYEQLAIEELKKAVSLNPNYADAHYRLCALYFKLGDREPAAKELEICSQLSSGDGAQLYRLALIVERFGDKRQAGPLYEKALATKSFGVGISLAKLRISQGRFVEAIRAVDHDLGMDPQSAAANFIKAEALARLGKTDEAMSSYMVAYRGAPCEQRCAAVVARRLHYLGKELEALEPAMIDLGCSSQSQELLEESKKLVIEILSRLPLRQSDPVVEEMGREVASSPGNMFFHLCMGDVYDRMGEPERAIREYEKGNQYASADNRYLWARGLYRLAIDEECWLRDYKKALNHYAQARLLDMSDTAIGLSHERLLRRMQTRNNDVAWLIKDWFWKMWSNLVGSDTSRA